MTLQIDWCGVGRFLAEGGEDLVARHWAEAGQFTDAIPLDLDWDRALQLERQGVFKALAARADGEIVGYSVFVVMPTWSARRALVAANDSIFLEPERRGHGAALIRRAEPMLQALGVRRIDYTPTAHVKLGSRRRTATVGDLLHRLGYAKVGEVYAKLV